jgi:hypothetical protein
MTEEKKHKQPEPASFSAGQSGVIKGYRVMLQRILRASKNCLKRGIRSRQALSSVWRTPKILAFPK